MSDLNFGVGELTESQKAYDDKDVAGLSDEEREIFKSTLTKIEDDYQDEMHHVEGIVNQGITEAGLIDETFGKKVSSGSAKTSGSSTSKIESEASTVDQSQLQQLRSQSRTRRSTEEKQKIAQMKKTPGRSKEAAQSEGLEGM